MSTSLFLKKYYFFSLIFLFLFLFIIPKSFSQTSCSPGQLNSSGFPCDTNTTVAWDSLNWYNNFEFNGNVYSKKDRTSNGASTNTYCIYQTGINPWPTCGFTIFRASSNTNTGIYVTPLSSLLIPYQNLSFTRSITGSSLSFDYSPKIPSTLIGFTNFTNSYVRFTYFPPISVQANRKYVDLKPDSAPNSNQFDIIVVGAGNRIRIVLNDDNLLSASPYDQYIIVNLDTGPEAYKNIQFYINCNKSSSPNTDALGGYNTLCQGSYPGYIASGSGRAFNFKGAIYGPFSVDGSIYIYMKNIKFIRIHERADLLLYLTTFLRDKKYEKVSSTLNYLKYD